MIALNETDEYAAEVPFNLPLAADPLTGLTGYVWTLGEVKVLLPGAGVWIDIATNKIIEKGYGRFAARLTSAQCTAAGTVAIYATATGVQPYRGSETIGTTGGDIAEGGIGYLMAYLPDAVDPVYGTPASGAFSGLAGALARVAWQDNTYVTIAAASVVEFGYGLYGIPVTTVNTVLRGKAYYYLEADGFQRFESYSTILGVSPATVIAPVEASTPLESPLAASSPELVGHVQAAIDRLCQYAKTRATA